MTSDYFDLERVVYIQFVSADSKYGIRFALNNVPEAQDSYVRLEKITVEMGYGNGPWQAWPCVTLTPVQLYMASRYL